MVRLLPSCLRVRNNRPDAAVAAAAEFGKSKKDISMHKFAKA